MTKLSPVYCAPYSIGDMLMTIPSIQQTGRQSILKCNRYQMQADSGLPRLINLLAPKIRMVLRDVEDHNLVDWYTRCQNDIHTPMYIRWALRFGLEPRQSLPRHIVEAVPRIGGDYILIHANSGTQDRNWDGWEQLDLSGIRYLLIGKRDDSKPLPGETVPPDFYEIARYMLGSRGLVCVNSSMMNLANVLGVQSVAINMRRNGGTWPNIGDRFYRPAPDEVSRAIRLMYDGIAHPFRREI